MTADVPLWKIMEGSFIEGRQPGYNDRHGYEAEIHAIGDWIAFKCYDEIDGIPDSVREVLAWLHAEARIAGAAQ